MRFDDTLETVLAADMDSDAGRQSAYRQLVDLIGRRRAPDDMRTIGVLASLARQVPSDVRAASARGLAFARPPAALVELFAIDALAVATPVLRVAQLDPLQWVALMPRLSPGARAILRHRRDLGDVVERALKAYEASDFVLSDGRAAVPAQADDPPPFEESAGQSVAPPPESVPRMPSAPFSTFGAIAMGLPVVAEAVSIANERAEQPTAPEGPFAISDVVARIDAFREQRERSPRPTIATDTAERFRFETDGEGVVRWADGAARAMIVGLSLLLAGGAGAVRIDNCAAGAFRKRSPFRDARMAIDASGDMAGEWLMSGVPVFDPASGRFQGYRGIVRRPQRGETATPASRRAGQSDALRQLVHELRTPTNAVIGFADMIRLEMLGPAPDPCLRHAAAIRDHARDLLAAIDDLDLAARIDSDSLTLRAEPISLRAMIASVADDLRPLCDLRRSSFEVPGEDRTIAGDRHALERLFGRLMATLLSAAGPGETIAMRVDDSDDAMASLVIGRPHRLVTGPDEVAIEYVPANDGDSDGGGLMPLGAAFALRLARNLASELGGSLDIGEREIVLCLPLHREMSERQATKS